MTRKLARDFVFKLLYQSEIQKEKTKYIFDIASQNKDIDEKSRAYIINTIEGIENNADAINALISDKSMGWKIERLSKITLASLTIGVYEILFNDDIPDTVAINEAVALAKTYEGEEAAGYVNGVLSSVLKGKN